MPPLPGPRWALRTSLDAFHSQWLLNSSLAVPAAQKSAFSTTSLLSARAAATAPPPKPRRQENTPVKGVRKTYSVKKARKVSTAKPPGPGERKAMRKRIILSNTNALEVQGLKKLEKEMFAGGKELKELSGKMMGLEDNTIDQLKAVQAFQPRQGWKMFRWPSVLMRKEAVDVGHALQNAENNKTSFRRVLVGDKHSGKSVLMLQAQAMAFLKGWVVIPIPDAQELTVAHTAYAPLPESDPPIYVQKNYTAELLTKISNANQAILSTMVLSQQHKLPIPVQNNISLDRFASLGARDPELAYPFFIALWKELTMPSQEGDGMQRRPVMLALDNLQHVMRPSEYLDPDLNKIHAHDLALVKHFMDHLCGSKPLPNGGAVLAALSESNRLKTKELDYLIKRNEALAAGPLMPEQTMPLWSPFAKMDEKIEASMADVEILRLKGLSREEARSIMEYWALSGLLRQKVTEAFVGEKWTLAGGGNLGEMEKAAVGMRV
ncbi:mitochondrial ribosomal protein Dap3 [Aulographum hederae CBS 113979]|uniref:Small ribosomal subunit protein mS29 n=1 Tax=Aulographum hederae CBS 113979 TaxID=1176131 RepID=A0A6G1GUG9_9PEZI|nr:mitochondrial ribosomal protein Dap3 [Aulographum hederae CBS 113979]